MNHNLNSFQNSELLILPVYGSNSCSGYIFKSNKDHLPYCQAQLFYAIYLHVQKPFHVYIQHPTGCLPSVSRVKRVTSLASRIFLYCKMVSPIALPNVPPPMGAPESLWDQPLLLQNQIQLQMLDIISSN